MKITQFPDTKLENSISQQLNYISVGKTNPIIQNPSPRLLPENGELESSKKLKIKKLSPELRRKRINFKTEEKWYKRIIWRLQEDSQFLRSTIQFSFLLLCIWIGIEFYLFMEWGISEGDKPFFQRPPGVEGFLPISALMSLKYWLQTGIINEIHPSGLFIFLAILSTGIFMKKAFCSWLCPVGTLSESLWILGKKMFGRNIIVTKWIDYPLRALKYLLLLFFVSSIWQMTTVDLEAFMNSPYNKMADVKMYQFFAHISSFALWTIIILMVFSVFIKNFWCRYLCPYGALLGIASWFSPLKITRNSSTCIDCELCTKACPATIKVHKAKKIWSDECMNCLLCVEACPVKETLGVRSSFAKAYIPNWILGSFIAGVFIAITGLAMLTGHWQNGISKEEYLRRFPQIESPLYQHNRGSVPQYSPQD